MSNDDYVLDKIVSIHDTVSRLDKELAVVQTTLSNHTAHDEKLDAIIAKHLADIHDTLDRNTNSLEAHMRRTLAVEQLIEDTRDRLTPLEIDKIKMDAINNWRKEMVVKFSKVAAGIAATVAVVSALLKLLG